MTDRTEQLVRDAFAEEAARAVDSREVLANVRGKRPRRSHGLVLATAAVVVVVAAVAAFVVPKVFQQSSVPVAGNGQQSQTAVKPTNVLVVGVDGVKNTDSMELVRLGADGSTSLVSLPRDTWVPSANSKLNQIYLRSGMDALVAAVGELTGVRVEHWAVADMAAVGAFTNAIGGVEVCLKAASSDRYAGADFPAGKQVVSGDSALAFVRQRHGLPNGDLDRIVRLQVFLRGVLAKLDAKNVSTLLAAVREHVQMDPGLDVVGFVQGLAANDTVHIGTIPVKTVDFQTPQSGYAIEVDPAQVKQFVTSLPSTQGTPVHSDVPCVN